MANQTQPIRMEEASQSTAKAVESDKMQQNVVVMRHGDRADNFEPMWATSAARPWDPPLIKEGLVRAFCTGRKIRQLGTPVNRVFVSPFLRCIQTASEVIHALCAIEDDPSALSSKDVTAIDSSKLKVSVEYGLCEMLNKEAIRSECAPKDGDFGFNLTELEAMFPAGTVDSNVNRVYEKMPEWEESVIDARTRYADVIKTLADKYPSENLLLVTHGEGVGVAVSAFMKNTSVYEVEYCAFMELRRPMSCTEDSFTAGDFKVFTVPALTGVGCLPPESTTDATP